VQGYSITGPGPSGYWVVRNSFGPLW
jgi:hypothetical protein